MSGQAFKIYLPNELAELVRRRAREQGRSGSSLAAEAIRARFDANRGAAEEMTHKRLLHRIDRRLDRIVRDQTIIKESVLVFVRVWLEHNPPIDDAIADAAAQSADARFERFCDFVVKGLKDHASVAGPEFAASIETVVGADQPFHEHLS